LEERNKNSVLQRKGEGGGDSEVRLVLIKPAAATRL
jgi:hypothetical protein